MPAKPKRPPWKMAPQPAGGDMVGNCSLTLYCPCGARLVKFRFKKGSSKIFRIRVMTMSRLTERDHLRLCSEKKTKKNQEVYLLFNNTTIHLLFNNTTIHLLFNNTTIPMYLLFNNTTIPMLMPKKYTCQESVSITTKKVVTRKMPIMQISAPPNRFVMGHLQQRVDL